MSRNQVTFRVALEVASHEALLRQAYLCSAGRLTWCVGMTDATGHRVARYIDNPAPLQHCMNLYAWALKNYTAGVERAFVGHTLTEAQFAAALSFHWNTGSIEEAAWVRHWKAGDYRQAREAFMNWSRPPEIIRRRELERDLFFDGKWSNDGTMLEYTRVTKRRTPDWTSGKRINVEMELRRAFAATPPVALDHAPQPAAKPPVPTLSPEGTTPPPAGFLATLLGLLARLFSQGS